MIKLIEFILRGATLCLLGFPIVALLIITSLLLWNIKYFELGMDVITELMSSNKDE